MKLSEFKFDLPNSLIANDPAENRDDARMMVIHKATGKIEHKVFKDIVNYFDEGDVFVGNDTMVFPARLYGRKEKTGAKIEVFLLRELNPELHLWDVLVDPARKIRVGNKLYFGDGDLVAEVVDNTTSRGRTIRFLYEGDSDSFERVVESLGETPLPKYIKRKVKPEDKERFQTIYAKKKGAVAAPTAGLDIDEPLLARLRDAGIGTAFVTLHVGAGTFQPVRVENIAEHRMHSEWFEVGADTVAAIEATRAAGGRVVAVGTTSLRALESAARAGPGGTLAPYTGETDIFITPGFEFRVVDRLVTNFHLPKSTLMMLVSAFAGHAHVMALYRHAVEARYRFFSYGDSMLLARH
ncbi:MAG TPA: tRNA preQ1(34) S-adenosylmethionine ribosyltransferase-isomerase QueA [Cytophagales bacterium]|nr:tRNA preQ1(34) S-adenosylmethionine ribosyltransferase-isomerase QueA [Cytophagales bacterium]